MIIRLMKKEATKKGEVKEKLFGFSALILLVVFLVIGIVFFVSLSIVKSERDIGRTSGVGTLSPDNGKNFSFGLDEIIFAIVFALFMTGFLVWTKALIRKNAYFGTIIGLVGSIMIGYGFYLSYRGPYSTGFMIVTALVVLVYIGMNFFRYRKEESFEEDED